MDLTECLYSGPPESARALAAELERQGVRCFVEDLFEFSVHSGSSVATAAELRVAPEDLDRARLMHDQWAALAASRISGTLHRVAWVLFFGALPPVVWIVSAWVAPESTPEPTLAGVAFVLLVSVVVVGQIEDRRFKAERLTAPPGTRRG